MINTQSKSRVFNVPVESLTPEQLKAVYQDIFRTLFYLRIGQLELVSSSKSQYLNEELKNDMREITGKLRSYDQKVRALVPPDMGKHLSQELSKDKIYDLTNIMESVAQITGESYEDIMSVAVDFIGVLASHQSKKLPLNTKKYAAIFRFMTAELKAEDGGQTCVSYDEKQDSITLNMVQPKSKANGTQSTTTTSV